MAVRVVIRWGMKFLWSCFEAELCGERSWLAVEVAERARAGCRTLPGAMPAPERLSDGALFPEEWKRLFAAERVYDRLQCSMMHGAPFTKRISA